MISLRSLMDLLPYYFKEQDTYKVNGKGLLERYLDIFGAYFDNQVVGDISTLDDILNVDKTPEIYLGYIWEFLGSMPYANPKTIDPEKWKQYFNGFSDDSTIQTLSRLWLYRKDSDGDYYNLTSDQVRALVKYSIALFSIRGTKKFFEVLLRLYGFEVVNIRNGSTYPKITVEDDDDSDYWGSDTDYYGTDDDYAGSIDSLFNIKTEATKLDSEWMNLDLDTVDNHLNSTRIVNVNFTLSSSYVYNTSSNEFKRLQDRMFNLINMFLPIGTRPHIIWDNVNVGNNYVPKVSRSIEVYVDRTPINWNSSDNVFVPSSEYPGWYRVYDRQSIHGDTPARSFDWSQLRFMVRVKDGNEKPAFILDQPKRFVVAFNGDDFSDTEYEDGHIFTIKPGGNGIYYPKFKVSAICEEDFDLTNGSLSTFIISSWQKNFNYNIFKHYNNSIDLKLSNSNQYIPILIQSASIRTYTNDANPDDDQFTNQQVVNLTTGEYLTLCENGTTLPDRNGNLINYSQYSGRCIYVQHLFEPGVYEFAVLERPEYKITIEITRVTERLTASLSEGLSDNVITNDEPSCDIKVKVDSNLNFLKKIYTLPFYIFDNGGDLWDYVVSTSLPTNTPASKVGNFLNKPYFKYTSDNLYYQNLGTKRTLPINFNTIVLSNPIKDSSQYLKFIITEYAGDVDNPEDRDITTITFYPVSGKIDAIREIYGHNVDGPVHEFKVGRNVNVKGYGIPITDLFTIQPITNNVLLDSDGSLIYGEVGVSLRNIFLRHGLSRLCPYSSVLGNSLYIEFSGLYDDEVLIKETSNPVTQYWNNGEDITLYGPGHYRFYGVNDYFDNVISNYLDVNVLSNKYNANYYLELEDGDKSDDEAYMVRTLITSRPIPGATVPWGFDFAITVDKPIIEAQDILVIDPGAFDLEVLLYRGGNPNRGNLLGSYTATVEVLTDDIGNILPYYKVKGTISLTWDGSYDLTTSELLPNYPPGLYCIELHDSNHVWEGSPSYRVLDAYVIPQKFDGNLYFDVDIISKAWTSPAGQAYDVDPVTGKYTWGWFKTNEDYLHSVRLVRYNPAISTPQFRLKLTNNTIGYNRVYMYKLVENGSEWDRDAAYPKVLPPIIRNTYNTHKNNPHWLDEAVPKDWGFPGEYNDDLGVWDYSKGSTGVYGYTGRWLFTGTIYQLGEIITGPQEPGKYLFLVNQLDIDSKVINYAYLEVKEEIQYSLIVDPLLAILQGIAVGTKVDAVSSAKFTKEILKIKIINPDGTPVEGYYDVPYAFYAYRAGTYTFELYKFEAGQHISLGLTANFKVLTDNGIYDEYLNWEWSNTGEKEVQVVTTSADVDWTVKVQTE